MQYFVQSAFHRVANTDHPAEIAVFDHRHMTNAPFGHLSEQIPAGIGKPARHDVARHNGTDRRAKQVCPAIGQTMDEIAFRDDAVDRLSVTRDNQRTDTCIAQSLYRGFYCGRGRDRIDLAALF